MHSDPDKDIKLWKDFLNGSKTALSKIYLTYVKHLYAFGCKFTADKSLVKDCIQELFVTLMRSQSKLSVTDNVKAYLFVALKRSILRELHRSTRFEQLIERGDYRFELAYEDFGRTQLEDDAISKKRMAVRTAVTTLTSRQKEALYLRYYVGLGHKEIAKILHLEEQSSRSLISRALKKVRNVIESDRNRISSFSFFFFAVFSACLAVDVLKNIFIPSEKVSTLFPLQSSVYEHRLDKRFNWLVRTNI